MVEAGAELTLKAGGSFVKVDAGGVHWVGPEINLNAGGSAGRGSAYGGQLEAAPRMLAQAKPVAELVQPDIAASMQSGAERVIVSHHSPLWCRVQPITQQIISLWPKRKHRIEF